MKFAPAYAALASLMLAACAPVPQTGQAGRLTTDADGDPIVVLSKQEAAIANQPDAVLQPMRLTRNGQTYLVQMRQTELPRPPLVDDNPNDGIAVVDDLILRARPDVAVSRAASAFSRNDRAEAEAVALAFCKHMGWTQISSAARQTPRFVPINTPGDSNEWVFPNWCAPEPAEDGGA